MACLFDLRLRHFPRGLGKGFDAALVGAWLGELVDTTDRNMIPAAWHHMYMYYACTLYGQGYTSPVKNLCVNDCNQRSKERYRDLFDILKFDLQSTNKFFGSIYCGRVWLPHSVAESVAKYGWGMIESFMHYSAEKSTCSFWEHKIKDGYMGCAKLASIQKWALWYIRPKIHMMARLMCLGCKKPTGTCLLQLYGP